MHKELVKYFAETIKTSDFDALELILSDKGEYDIQDDDDKVMRVSKKEYLKWIRLRLKYTDINTINYDQCLYCKMGNPVVIFNNGRFPRKIICDSECSMTGIMIDILDNKIVELKFCYYFLNQENRYEYECVSELIKKLENQGYSFNEAYRIAKESRKENF